ncbi:Flagellar motor rotation protein MotB [hydrothermal vent metagenome]|uniref:Flagellar motor rotation protein MotB n=1 Tax=hydrothermal vent metagenome TaxID=652676 RepID=A0A3B1AWG5_9ZZZZ
MTEDNEQKCDAGSPPWMATFADMMALLMCFFVLLLSFAEMDAIRFKKMAESMKDAFGVQREIPTNEIVKGISVIKQEFSASISDPTIKNEIKQETADEEKTYLEVNEGALSQGSDQNNIDVSIAPPIEQASIEESKEELTEKFEEEPKKLDINEAIVDAVEAKLAAEAAAQAAELREELKKEIEEGLISVETADADVIVRINEKGSFPSGSADLNPGFIEVMERITVAISTKPGKIVVAGHTDNVPISTRRFRSNWELSSARAVTVVHALLTDPTMDPERFLVEGHADSNPLAPNDSSENRAVNRRVELIIKRSENEALANESVEVSIPATKVDATTPVAAPKGDTGRRSPMNLDGLIDAAGVVNNE